MAMALAYQAGFLPIATVHAHVHPSDRRSTGPGDAPDGEVAVWAPFSGGRLCDQGAYTLQGERFSGGAPVLLALKDVAIGLKEAFEGIVDALHLRQPFHRRDGVPAGNDEAQWIA